MVLMGTAVRLMGMGTRRVRYQRLMDEAWPAELDHLDVEKGSTT